MPPKRTATQEQLSNTPKSFHNMNFQPYIPPNATVKEKIIHEFLTQHEVFTVDVKQMLEDLSKDYTPSTRLQLALKERTTKRGNLLHRRQNSANNVGNNTMREKQSASQLCQKVDTKMDSARQYDESMMSFESAFDTRVNEQQSLSAQNQESGFNIQGF
ncbi:UNKNOWN [Stylonychia lemnae]|uniref:Uncharacterized protein n=1 Tax=Stylonychia lemnae TaxID=5949 RepID=A0A077ZQ51_STYLE|nr:UNKNOWN [Stylonychia lemnae]|eukprot:CDW71510.1 UNKNOWN [Stylonychia lemnae]